MASAALGCGGKPVESSPSAVKPRATDVKPSPQLDPRFTRSVKTFADLPGWRTGDHVGALSAMAAQCAAFVPSDPRNDAAAPAGDQDWIRACRGLMSVGAIGEADMTQEAARQAIEAAFRPELLSSPVGDLGLVTAYYEPVLDVRRTPDAEFREPILATPPDLVVETVVSDSGREREDVFRLTAYGERELYPPRSVIREAPVSDQIIAWGRLSDVVFLQIQGSGRLSFDDGTMARAAFDATNGLDYVSIADSLVARGLMGLTDTSNENIKAWLEAAEPQLASDVVDDNPRYVFFRLEPVGDPILGPAGNAGVALRAKVSAAIDPEWHDYGSVYWIAAEGQGAPPPQYGIAQDKGAAIRGPLRADLFFGVGSSAGLRASRVRHEAEWWALVPRPTNERGS